MDHRPPLLLSIDFEDWHQLVHRRLGRADWDRPNAAFPPQVHAVLDLLDEIGARATFFLLGMTVANYPELGREIVDRGHEPASHGFAHIRVHEMLGDVKVERDDRLIGHVDSERSEWARGQRDFELLSGHGAIITNPRPGRL